MIIPIQFHSIRTSSSTYSLQCKSLHDHTLHSLLPFFTQSWKRRRSPSKTPKATNQFRLATHLAHHGVGIRLVHDLLPTHVRYTLQGLRCLSSLILRSLLSRFPQGLHQEQGKTRAELEVPSLLEKGDRGPGAPLLSFAEVFKNPQVCKGRLRGKTRGSRNWLQRVDPPRHSGPPQEARGSDLQSVHIIVLSCRMSSAANATRSSAASSCAASTAERSTIAAASRSTAFLSPPTSSCLLSVMPPM